MGSSLNGTGVTFSDGSSQSTRASTAADVQTFNSTGTWTKPTGGQTMAIIRVWGGGGGGSRSGTNGNWGGGGGGGYNELTVPISYLNSGLTVTVGGGGTGATTTAAGSAGGNSSVPLNTTFMGQSTIYGYGGGGALNGSNAGGSGGGQLGAGSGGASGAGLPKLNISSSTCSCNTFQSSQGSSPNGTYAGGIGSIWHGGGGTNYTNGYAGSSLFGGGGGAGSTASRGISLYGGNGGNGAGIAGTAPGGGGGCGTAINQNGGNGAAGRVIIICY